MKLTTKGRYAVMAVADIAAQGMNACVSLPDIAARQGMSLTYLEQLMAKLRRAGIVESERGAQGGYRLMSKAAEIDLSTVIFAVDEDIKAHGCSPEIKRSCMGKSERCITHNLWGALEAHIEGFLSGISVQDVIDQNFPPAPVSAQVNMAAAL